MGNSFVHWSFLTLERRYEAVISTFRVVGITFLILFSTASNAVVVCREHIAAIVLHSTSGGFFTTDKTCLVQPRMADTNAIKRGYSMLLAAKFQGKNIVFSLGKSL